MKRTTKDIALPSNAAERDSTGVIPIVEAENTVIASDMPRFPGVIPIRIARFAIDERNSAEANEISIPKVRNCKYSIKVESKI